MKIFHRPVFRPVLRTLGNSHRVSNSHLTFSSVVCGCVLYMYNYLSIALQKHSSLRIEEAQTIQVSKRYRHILDFDGKTLANGVI